MDHQTVHGQEGCDKWIARKKGLLTEPSTEKPDYGASVLPPHAPNHQGPGDAASLTSMKPTLEAATASLMSLKETE